MTLAEVMIAIAICSTVLAAGTAFFMQSLRSSAAVANYYNMDNSSRSALSRMTREIRQADSLTSFSATQIVFLSTNPPPNNPLGGDPPGTCPDHSSDIPRRFSYTYDPAQKTLTRKEFYPISLNEPYDPNKDVEQVCKRKVILKGCQSWTPAFYQRNTIPQTYDQYDALGDKPADLCKVIQLSWRCSRKVSGLPENTEAAQSAKVVMRKP